MGFFDYFDLSKECDACGNPVGGGAKWCPKCKITLRHQCQGHLLVNQVLKDLNDIHLHCPMCGKNFQPP